jgi:hypothetical protein
MRAQSHGRHEHVGDRASKRARKSHSLLAPTQTSRTLSTGTPTIGVYVERVARTLASAYVRERHSCSSSEGEAGRLSETDEAREKEVLGLLVQ